MGKKSFEDKSKNHKEILKTKISRRREWIEEIKGIFVHALTYNSFRK